MHLDDVSAVNVLLLALPTIQRRIRLYDRHARSIAEAGDRDLFRALLLLPPSISSTIGGSQSGITSRRTGSGATTVSGHEHASCVPGTQTSPSASASATWLPMPSSGPRRQRRATLSPVGATHALGHAIVAVTAAADTERPASARRCRFSSIDRVAEYDVESDVEDEPSPRSQSLAVEDEEELLTDEVTEEDEETSDDEDDLYDEFAMNHERPHSARTLFARVGCGLSSAVSAIGARPRLSLAEPSLRRFIPSRKSGIDQSMSARASTRSSFMCQSTPQQLGLHSLMPLLAASSHESFRRCSDSISATIRSSNSTADTLRSAPAAGCNHTANGLINGADHSGRLRPFSTSPTARPAALPLTPRPSFAVATNTIGNALQPSLNGASSPDCGLFSVSAVVTPRSSCSSCHVGASVSPELVRERNELILNVAHMAQATHSTFGIQHDVVTPGARFTVTPVNENASANMMSVNTRTAPFSSVCKSPVGSLRRQSSTIIRSREHRERIWAARARFFRDADYNSPLMLRRFVLDVANDTSATRRRFTDAGYVPRSPSAPDLPSTFAATDSTRRPQLHATVVPQPFPLRSFNAVAGDSSMLIVSLNVLIVVAFGSTSFFQFTSAFVLVQTRFSVVARSVGRGLQAE